MHPGSANTEQVMVTTATTHPQLPLADADTAGTGGAHLGAHDPEVPSQLTELYLRAREQVGDMSAARRFWRARDELRVQEQPARSDHGEGVWTPEARTPAGSDVENRVKELEARMKALADVAKVRMSPAGSFASAGSVEAIGLPESDRPALGLAPGSLGWRFASQKTKDFANMMHEKYGPSRPATRSHEPVPIATPAGPDPGPDPSYELLRRQRDHEHRIEMRQLQIERNAVDISTPKMPPVSPPPGLGQRQQQQQPVEHDDDYDGDYEDPDEGDDYENNFEAMRAAAVIGAPPSPPSSSSSSTTSSSSSSSRKKKIKKKLKKKKKKKVTAPYKVKSGDIRLPPWPTVTGFPAWRRTLRQAVISASERPERARPWIFEVEKDDVTMDELHCNDHDKQRTLDAKLADALQKVLKGEPARKVALATERAALTHEILSGRQILLLIYQEFKRTEARTDAAAYSNLENIRCGNTDHSLEAFMTLWENLLLSFRTPPSADHLFSVFMSRVKHLPGLATTMAYLKRIPYGHADKNITFLKDACVGLIEEIRTERQLAEVAKVYKNGGTDVALVMTEEQKKKAPCFKLRDGQKCPLGNTCPYSHDGKIIAEARAKAQARAKAKAHATAPAPAAPALGKGNGKGKSKGKDKGKTKGKKTWDMPIPSGTPPAMIATIPSVPNATNQPTVGGAPPQ